MGVGESVDAEISEDIAALSPELSALKNSSAIILCGLMHSPEGGRGIPP